MGVSAHGCCGAERALCRHAHLTGQEPIVVTIRCHPRVPVATEELERWLQQELAELRREAPEGTIRLLRLTQELPSTEVGIGWLIELELPGDGAALGRDRLAPVLRDLRLLGLQPTLLVSPGAPGRAAGPAPSLR
jgi:hypothetical protein